MVNIMDKKAESLVSVIIPTYNRPVYLKRAIESVLNQKYSPIEIIVVDDNNPADLARKETEKLMEEYQERQNIVYLKHEKNKNGSAARNTGYRHAKGEYITFLDDDDELDSRKIQAQVERLEMLDGSWGACYTAYHTLRPKGLIEKSCEMREGNCYVYALMKTLFLGSGSNLLLRRSVVEKINGYDESFKRSQDLEFLVRVSEVCKISFVDEDLLTVHWEEGRKKSYSEVKGYCDYYREKFESRINKLSASDKERVITVITLDQFKVALRYGKVAEACTLLKDNHIKFKYLVKYVNYIIRRLRRHESYGFYI